MAQDRLRIEHISKAYTEGYVTITDASLQIGVGEIHGLLGENGAGKSTLVKIISGELQRDGGVFEVDGAAVSERKRGLHERHHYSFREERRGQGRALSSRRQAL